MTTPWRVIKESLVRDGVMTEQSVTRTPKARHCRSCGRSVIAAITDLGFEIAVEPTATTPAGELATVMNGRDTYALLDHGEMVRRSHHRITFMDANNERTHAQHHCHSLAPEINPLFATKKKRIDIPDQPDF